MPTKNSKIEALWRLIDKYRDAIERFKDYPALDQILNKGQMESIHRYVADPSINEDIRAGRFDELTRLEMAELDDILKGKVLAEPMPLFRGIRMAEGEAPKAIDPGFKSWTVNHGASKDFADSFGAMRDPDVDSYILFGEFPKNHPGLPIREGRGSDFYESEVLMPRGAHIKFADEPFEYEGAKYIPVEPYKKYAKGGKIDALPDAVSKFMAQYKEKMGFTPLVKKFPEGVWYFKDLGGEWGPVDKNMAAYQTPNWESTEEVFPKSKVKFKWDQPVHKPQYSRPVPTAMPSMWPTGTNHLDHWPPVVREALLNVDEAEELRKMHGPLAGFVTPEEFDAVADYVGPGYYGINRFLRNETALDWPRSRSEDRDYARTVGLIDTAIDRSKLLSGMKLFRGINGIQPKDFVGEVDHGFSSWSINPSTAHSFGANNNPSNIMIMDVPAGIRGLPINNLGVGEMEVILPRGHVFDQLRPTEQYQGVNYIPVRLRNEYAKGGEVKRKNALKALSDIVALAAMTPGVTQIAPGKPKRAQLFAQGVLSQLYGLDEEGEPAFLGGSSLDHWPGLVDEILALPTILPEKYVPEASNRASERLERLNELIHEDMGLGAAEGITENMYNAAGVMAAQIPTGGASAAKTGVTRFLPKARRAVGNVLEWFTPTVNKTPGSYITGTAVGGGLNSLESPADETEGVRPVSKYDRGGSVGADMARMKGKYAAGGKAQGAVKAINKAISAIEKGDRAGAASILEPHRSNPEVAGVLKDLKGDAE